MNQRVLQRDQAVKALRTVLGYRESLRSVQGYWLIWHSVHALPMPTSNTTQVRQAA